MLSGEAKRIVVIKDISSDLVEEAILILKPQKTMQSGVGYSAGSSNISKEKKGQLLKEAESIISSYIRENKLNILPNGGGLGKVRISGKSPLVSLIINILMMSSIALLIYVTIKLF